MDESGIDEFRARLLRHARKPAVSRALVEAIVKAARSAAPKVAALPEQETRLYTQVLLDGILTDSDQSREEVLAAAERLGSARARQGVPVAALLDGVQASRSCLIQVLVDHGQTLAVPPETILKVVIDLDAVITAVVHRMVHTHRETELELARSRTELQTQTLRQLLHGEPTTSCAPLTASIPYHCVVSDISDPAHAQRLAAMLTTACTGPGLYGLVDGRLAALLPRLPHRLDDVPLLVAAPAATPAQVAPLYQLARQALQAGQAAGLTGLRTLPDLALLTATHTQPALGAMLASQLLTGLDAGDPFHHDLAHTALAYLDHRGRIEPTAAALHIHTNTVKYRLRRLRELTGHSLLDPDHTTVTHTTHWWWALHYWISLST